MVRQFIALLAILTLTGCGPLTFPAVQRLDPEEQARVDSSWNNMLAPAGRLDRQVLLDTLILFQLHQAGVDCLVLRSEKTFDGGTAVMEVHHDRANPTLDRFEVRIYDTDWRMVRHEQYPSDEVFQVIRELSDAHTRPCDGDGNCLPLEPEREERIRIHEERMRRVAAATQPAR